MVVRKIKPGEVRRTSELFSIAFEIPFEEPSGAPSRENAYQLERYAAFEDDNETMTSCLFATPFRMTFDGSEVDMTGIGGVSSLPHFRRNGGIRGCFQKMLPDLYEKKVAFSYLYPFSTAYYRKYGYEQAGMCWLYEWDLSQIPFAEREGKSILIDKSNAQEALPEFKKLYKKWQDEYTGMIVNEDWEFEFVVNADPYKKQEFTYLYRNSQGEPAGYMTFHKEKVPEGQKLMCTKFVFDGLAGFKGLMTLAKSFASDHLSISFRIPESMRLESAIKEWSLGAVKMTPVILGMIRAVDVMQVLQKAKYQGSDSIRLKILDECIPQNTGIYHVVFEDGKAVSVEKLPADETEWDASMGVNIFSRFIYGCTDLSALEYCEDMVLGDNPDALERLKKVFYHKNYYLMEYF